MSQVFDAGGFTQDKRERLRQHFADSAPDEHGERWNDLWVEGDCLPWDRGEPSPALFDALSEKPELFQGTKVVDDGGVERRKRALVPGCGRGYDCLLLAALGYDCVGLDVSERSLEVARAWAGEHHQEYMDRYPDHEHGTYTFVKGDFFRDDWLRALDLRTGEGVFELIYDYTFFCALHPDMRPDWAKRMSTLLAPRTGRLVCLEFPTFKDPKTGGPPFGLKPQTYLSHLRLPGETLEYNFGYPEQISAFEQSSIALERIEHYRPQRTHKVGEGTDWLSVWKKL